MSLDLSRLFKLRAAVGRFGEMDCAGWWNTHGVLGARGAAVYERGLPRTHFLARVRVVSSIAEERSNSVYPAPGVATLWSLPAALERALSFQERAWATNGGQGMSGLSSRRPLPSHRVTISVHGSSILAWWRRVSPRAWPHCRWPQAARAYRYPAP